MRCLLVILSLLLFLPGIAQSKKSLSKNDFLVSIWLKDGTKKMGIWEKSNGTTIQYSDQDQLFSITPESIYKLEFHKVNSTRRNAIIGASVGFSIGFLIGFTGENEEGYSGASRVGHAAGVGLIGAFSGAFLGHLSGMFGKSYLIMGSTDQFNKINPELQKYNRSSEH